MKLPKCRKCNGPQVLERERAGDMARCLQCSARREIVLLPVPVDRRTLCQRCRREHTDKLNTFWDSSQGQRQRQRTGEASRRWWSSPEGQAAKVRAAERAKARWRDAGATSWGRPDPA